ncbi:hypothetical protein DAPPUDRAFT_325787 [Daphnia pulex]|uniref:Peptidase S1 domain-containing protein n=1 Tax=Daphnia pulex TaxID=6669 RepID=E9H5K5_DAPPU|nr:hypothetical protein DAPPUDRAFT_325787 [Daphnia pulex]|eukprot:EFX72985.1 hypothetical protein DAPPUDRAFT_325787 [Daphnia pulex]
MNILVCFLEKSMQDPHCGSSFLAIGWFCLVGFVHSKSLAAGQPINGTNVPSISIYGGTPAVAGEFPFMASLLVGSSSFCGATLIGPSHLLTAAHCIENATDADLKHSKISINGLNILGNDTTAIKRNASKFIKHESYVHTKLIIDHDIAIVVLSSPVKNIRFSSLPTKPADSSTFSTYQNKTAVATGWGGTQSGSLSWLLLKANLTIQTTANCLKQYTQDFNAVFKMCAKGLRSQNTCPGDSGGPLMVSGVQVGIVSYGKGACGTIPSVFTRVSAYLNWISTTLARNPAPAAG